MPHWTLRLTGLLSLLLSGCVAMAGPPQVTGWWVLDKQPNDLYHIDADTRMYEYNADWQQPLLFLDECDLYLPMRQPNGAFKLRWTYGGFADTGGLYHATLHDSDTLVWQVIDDNEHQRLYFFGDATMTRARTLESALGAWQATPPGIELLLRDNLTYAVMQTRSQGPSTPILQGEFRWAQQAGELWFRDPTLAACGGSARVGRYQVELGAPGALALLCIEDPCPIRREALTTGPLHKKPSVPAIAGQYVDWTTQRHLLQLTETGVYRRWDLDRELLAPAEGSYELFQQTLRLSDQAGNIHCDTTQADYAITRVGGALKLEAIHDECASRRAFFEAHPIWAPREWSQ